MGPADIIRIVPHRHPMLLIDRVETLCPGELVVATKAVTVSEPCYAGIADGATAADFAYPQSLLVESWATAAEMLMLCRRPAPHVDGGHLMVAGAIDDVAFHIPVHPGDVLRHEVRVVKLVADTAILAGDTRCDGELVAAFGHFVAALRPTESLRAAPTG